MKRGSLLTDGIGQSLHLCGRTFHVQTEMSHGGVRTEIFLGGRLMAAREMQLGDREGGLETQRQQMNEHHQSIMSAVRKRAQRFQQHGSSAREAAGAEAEAPGCPSDPGYANNGSGKGRSSTSSASTAISLRVRNLLREFRHRIDTKGRDEAERLERAHPAFSWIIASPLFESLRIDEQLRLHLLQNQIDVWRRDGADEVVAAEIRQDLARFSSYLAGIENRAEFGNVNSGNSGNQGSGNFSKRTTPYSMKESQAVQSPNPDSPHDNPSGSQMEKCMAKVNLEPLSTMDGFIGTCIVDSESGMMLGNHGGGSVNLEVAAAGNTQVVRAKRKTMDSLKLSDQIEDILISLRTQYHVIRPLESNPRIFLYLVLDREKSNLAMARHDLRAFEEGLSLG